MTSFFVSRHEGAVAWAAARGIAAVPVGHLDLAQVGPGDVVIGTLPLHLAAGVCERGARFLALDMDLPADWRGRALSAAEMEACGARLTEYQVVRVGEVGE